MSAPIRLRHAVVPLLAMPAGGKFQIGFTVAAGYDPADVVAWRVELAARYGANRTPWVGSVVSVSGQDFSFAYEPTDASDDDEDVTLADVAEAGNCAWSVTALDGDDLPLWRVQGDVDFVEGVGDPDTGNGVGAGNPILIRVDEGETITLAISTGADGDASYTYIGYALDNQGAGFATTPGQTRNFVAFLTTTAEIETPTAADFSGLWQQYKGGEGTGDVAGPASAVAGNFASYSGTSGKILQDSGSSSASFAAASHSHAIGDVTGLQTALDGKAATSHSHAIGDVTNLQTALDGKAATSHSHAIGDVTGLQTALDGKAATSHSHAIGDVTGLQTALDGKAATSHSHAISDVTGLQTALDGKAATSHSHSAFTGDAGSGGAAGFVPAPAAGDAAAGKYLDADGTWTVPPAGGGGVADGDKGDITVSASGATWTIDNDAVTYAKLQNISATSRVLGRKGAGAGDAEECTLSEILDFVGSAAQGDILYRGASGWARLAAGTSGHYLKTLGSGANPEWAAVPTNGQLGIVIDGAGSVITTGVKGYLRVPYACTINSVEIVANASGNMVIDIWRKAYANFPPVVGDAITGSAKPTLSSAQKSQSSTLTGWTTTLSEGDYLAFNVDSAATVSRVTLTLIVTRTI